MVQIKYLVNITKKIVERERTNLSTLFNKKVWMNVT